MKKYSWIVALLLALTLGFVFASCDNGEGGDGKDPRKVAGAGPVVTPPVTKTPFTWNLSEVLEDIGAKVLTNSDFTDTGVSNVGDPDYEIKESSGGSFVLEITTRANWGQGIDLLDSVFEFEEGDEVTFEGTYEGTPTQVYLSTKAGNGETHLLSPLASPFQIKTTLTATDIENIAQTGTNINQAIRLAVKPDNITFTITEVTVKGER